MTKRKSCVTWILTTLLLLSAVFEPLAHQPLAAENKTITARINQGEVLSGVSLQDIVENQMKLEQMKVEHFVIMEGLLTSDDVDYMEDAINPEHQMSVVIHPQVDVTQAFPDGFEMYFYDPGLKHIEMAGIKSIERVRYEDGVARMSFPDAEVISSSAFDAGGVETVYFKNMKEIGRYAFDESKLKNLILTGNQVPTADETVFRDLDPEASVWVPQAMVESYRAVDDGDTADSK